MNTGRIVGLAVAAVALVVTIVLSGNMVEGLDANQQMVIQSPSGRLEAYFTPGWKAQWFGRVTKYDKRRNYDFLIADPHDKVPVDNSVEVRFNDGGHGRISGTVAYEMPQDAKTFLNLHMLYGSQDAVEKRLVAPVVAKSIYYTGPLMSSKESYSDRRNELLSLIDDQIRNGVLRTVSEQIKQPDPITGVDKTVTHVKMVLAANGVPLREGGSPLNDFGIKTFNLSISKIAYAPEVEQQIKQQQEMVMAVQTSIMEAKKAEQQRMTTEQSGMADAAKAKWEQEVAKVREVTEAQKRKDVAALDVQTAELQKRAQILRGEGEAGARRLVMSADGALSLKLQTYQAVMSKWAEAVASYQGQWVPTTVMGAQSATNGTGGAQQLIDMLSVRTAQDLALDPRVSRVASKK